MSPNDELPSEEEAYLWDPAAAPVDSVRALERKVEGERLSPAARFAAPRRSRAVLFALGALATAAAAVLVLRPIEPDGAALTVLRGASVEQRGLTVQRPLVTTDQPARIQLGYGEVTVLPGSQVRLVKLEKNEHRLALDHGVLEAKVNAPPRLFAVDVPGGQVVDLGCAYRLSVGEAGQREVEVMTGYVELEGAGRKVVVPAGARTRFHSAGWPRTPVDTRATAAWSAALNSFEDDPAKGDAAALAALAEARDAVSLWNLLPRAEASQRGVLSARLKQLAGVAPEPWSADDLARLEPKAVESAWDAVVEQRDATGPEDPAGGTRPPE